MYTLANSGALRLWTYFCDNKRGLKIGRKLEISEKMYVASQRTPPVVVVSAGVPCTCSSPNPVCCAPVSSTSYSVPCVGTQEILACTRLLPSNFTTTLLLAIATLSCLSPGPPPPLSLALTHTHAN